MTSPNTGLKLVICGGRDFTERRLLRDVLDRIEPRPTLIIEGGQRTYDRRGRIIGGADYWAMRWARLRDIPWSTYEARWEDLETPPVAVRRRRDGTLYNAAAGGIRNQRMLDEGRPQAAVGFPGGSGTADMLRRARAAGLPVLEIPRSISAAGLAALLAAFKADIHQLADGLQASSGDRLLKS